MNIDSEIETGRYFKAALDWHTSTYLYCYTQFTYMLIVTLLTSFAAVIAVNLAITCRSTKQYPVVSYIDDQVNYITRIHPILLHIGDSVNKSVARYIITMYIESRESYKYEEYSNKETWKQKIAFLQSNSSKKVFSEFLNYMDMKENPNSPVLKYKTQKDVNVENIEFLVDQNRLFGATVKFLVTEFSHYNTVFSKCIAELIFSLTDIEKVIDKGITLNFKVISYNSSCNL